MRILFFLLLPLLSFSQSITIQILGTTAKGNFPVIDTFLHRLFGKKGTYAHMQDILTPTSDSFQIKPVLIGQNLHQLNFTRIKVTAIGVHHGSVPEYDTMKNRRNSPKDACQTSHAFTSHETYLRT